jgi:hypothetical protein
LEESDLNQEKFKSSITVLMEEKEELAMVVLLQLFFILGVILPFLGNFFL